MSGSQKNVHFVLQTCCNNNKKISTMFSIVKLPIIIGQIVIKLSAKLHEQE